MNKQILSLLCILISISLSTVYSYCAETESLERQLNQQIRQNQAQEQSAATRNQTAVPVIAPPAIDISGDWIESFSISFGSEMAFGNTRSISGTYNLRYTASYKQIFDINTAIEGAYGESYDTGLERMKKDRNEHKLTVGLDRWFLERILAVTYNTELTTNQFSNIYIRWTNGLGIKVKPVSTWWIDTSISISPSVEYVKTYDLLTRQITWTITYTIECNFNFDKEQTVSLNNSLSFIPKFTNYKNYRLNLTSSFTVKFLRYFTISINFTYEYVSMPPNEYTAVKNSDYRLSTTLGFSI